MTMWWETVLIALLPSVGTMLLTNWFNKKRYKAEIDNMTLEGKSIESRNMQIILETYKITLEQYKTEIEEINNRFAKYIEQATVSAEAQAKKIVELERKVSNKDSDIQELKKKLNALLKGGVNNE